MARDQRSGLSVYLIIVILVVALFGGIVYWSVPVVIEQRIEQIPVVPNGSEPKSKVLLPPVNAAEKRDISPIPEIVSRVGSSVVKITTVQNRTRHDFFRGDTREQVTGEGSGVIVDEQGYILTNNHVVEDADEIVVLLTDRKNQEQELKGEVLGRDPLTDLAVVKVEGSDLSVATLGDSDQLMVGETAIAIGNPYGFTNTVTVGVISALNRDLPIQEGTELLDLVQTDAAINPGNSGGALFNIFGEVVGINTVILQGAQGLGFAIPINIAREISRELIQTGKVERPWMGIFGRTVSLEAEDEGERSVTGGVLIYQVIQDSPADRAGFREGDVILGFGDVDVNSMEGLLRELRNYDVGEEVQVRIFRKDREQMIQLELQERPLESYQ